MALVLYDNPASSNAMKVRLLLAELGEAYERRRVPLARPRPDWYLERYRFGTIPFLEDGELALGESNTILRYLAQSRGRHDLYPSEPRARARVDWALDAWSTQIRGGLFPVSAVRPRTDAHLAATVPQIESVRAPLIAVADHRNPRSR